MLLRKGMAEMKVMSGAGIDHVVEKKTLVEIGPVSILSPDLGEKNFQCLRMPGVYFVPLYCFHAHYLL